MRHIIIFTTVLFLLCCNNKEKKLDNNVITINPADTKLLPKDLFQDYYSVALETTGENLIAGIDKIEITEDKFYIFDKKNATIWIFDLQGYYLSKIDRMGEGPEEYIDITDFTVRDSFIYILSRGKRMIFVYDGNDSFVRRYELDDRYEYFFIDGDMLYLHSCDSNDKHFNLIVAKFTGDAISLKKEFLPFKKNQSIVFPPSPFNRTFNGEILLCHQFDYNIYRINNDSISIADTVDFDSEEKIPKNYKELGLNEVRQRLLFKPVVTSILHANRVNNYLYLSYVYNFKAHITKLDIGSKVAETLRLERDDVFPFVFFSTNTFHKDYLVGWSDASGVLTFDKEFKSDKNENGYLSEEDNPVLFFHQFK